MNSISDNARPVHTQLSNDGSEGVWRPGGWEDALTPRERAVLVATREVGHILNKEIIAKIRIPVPKP